jgi:hypothetical protein
MARDRDATNGHDEGIPTEVDAMARVMTKSAQRRYVFEGRVMCPYSMDDVDTDRCAGCPQLMEVGEDPDGTMWLRCRMPSPLDAAVYGYPMS